MKIRSISFKSVARVIDHLFALAQFACNINPSDLPLLDFISDSVTLSKFLHFRRKYSMSKPLYLVYRTHGFAYFASSAEAVIYKNCHSRSYIACYTLHYSVSKDVFIIEPVELC